MLRVTSLLFVFKLLLYKKWTLKAMVDWMSKTEIVNIVKLNPANKAWLTVVVFIHEANEY